MPHAHLAYPPELSPQTPYTSPHHPDIARIKRSASADAEGSGDAADSADEEESGFHDTAKRPCLPPIPAIRIADSSSHLAPLLMSFPHTYFNSASAGPSSGTTFQPVSLRPETDTYVLPPSVPDGGGGVDMGKSRSNTYMAPAGSMAAAAGIHTPLAQYAASMAVWLWFGEPASSSSPNSSLSTTSPIPHDPFELPRHPRPLNPLQFHPSAQFTQFVAQLLQITMVSHSVTLVALLYIHRLKSRNSIPIAPGTEHRPFIASLILSNKYLDDNTYTNKTWAELTGLPVGDINRMEAEFLLGLSYNLGVRHAEYLQWRQMLDGFIFSRDAMRGRASIPQPSSPPSMAYTPPPGFLAWQSPFAATAPYRTRSASPPFFSAPEPFQGFSSASPAHARKRSAYDAFAADPAAAVVYESFRRPARKAAFERPASAISTYTFPYETQSDMPTPQNQTSNSSFNRSSSLNRQIARLPGEGGRRGSVGHVHAALPEMDLRHAAAAHATQARAIEGWARTGRMEHDAYSALVAPVDRMAQPQAVPPEHLVFYTLAADARPGPDGAPRKAIMRYHDPSRHPFAYEPPSHSMPSYAYPREDISMIDSRTVSPAVSYPSIMSYPAYDLGQSPPYPGYHSYPGGTYPQAPALAPAQAQAQPPAATYAEPEPAQFANAGPPGYAYDPHIHVPGPSHVYWNRSNRLSAGSEEMLGGNGNGNGYSAGEPTSAGVWTTRSEWSSPLPGYEGQFRRL